MRRGGLRVVRTSGQRGQHAAAHFCRRLAREGDGDHFFGRFHAGEQGQITLNQQFSFARPCRRLHDERARHVEGVLALLLVRCAMRTLCTLGTHASSPSAAALRAVNSCTRHKVFRPQYSQVFG